MVSIEWLGHASFEIKDDVTIITDPHGGTVGIPFPERKADIVLVSHSHYDHATGIEKIVKKGVSVILMSFKGEKTVKGVKIKGYRTYHDEVKGMKRGENTAYKFELDNISFLHLGDLGEIPSIEFGDVDVLFVPVGGVYTLDAEGAKKVVDKIKPKIVIPMHYKVKGLSIDINGVEPFLKFYSNVERVDRLNIDKKSLPDFKVVVFNI